MALFRKTGYEAGQVDMSRLPRHIAIIMDGNGRWAKKRGLPRTAGHKAGAETFRDIATYCKELGIQYLTIYAFSTENWRRPPEEVSGIMDLFPGALRGMGYSTVPMLLSVAGTVGTRLVWIYGVFPFHRSIDILFISYPASWFVTIVFQVMCYIIVRKKLGIAAWKSAVRKQANNQKKK